MLAWHCLHGFLLGLFLLFVHLNHHSRARAVAVDGASLAPTAPSLDIESVDKFLVNVVRKIHGDADRVVNPFLDSTLHAHLHQPVNIVGGGFIVWRLLHQSVNLLLGVTLLGVYSVYLHPVEELLVINNVLLERVAHLIDEIHMSPLVTRIHLAAALIHRQEHRLNATRCLCHERCGARRCYGEARDVAAAIFLHVLIEFRVGIAKSHYERVVLFAFGIENLECAALLCHQNRRAVCRKGECLMNIHREVGGLLSAVTQSHSGYHVAFGSDAHTCSASLRTLVLNLLPQMILSAFHLVALRVALYLVHDEVYLLHLQIDDVVHYALSQCHMFAEQVVVEVRLFGERLLNVTEKVYRQQSARVVRTERNLAAGVGRDGAEAQVGIAVGDALAQDSVPEEHSWLGAFPCVVDNLLPKSLCADGLLHHRVVAVDGELLHILLVLGGCLHELIVYLHRHIGTSHLAFGHLSVDESLAVGVLDAYREHQRAAPSVLCHLACGVAVALHEGHQSCRGECRVVHRRTLGAYLAEVVTYSSATFHQLHLLLIDAHHGTIRVGIAVKTDDKAVAERSHLEVVSYSRHRRTSRNDIAEVVEQCENLLRLERVGVFLLNAFHLFCYSPMHVLRTLFVNITETVLHRVLIHPYAGSEFVAIKIFQGLIECFLLRIGFTLFHNCFKMLIISNAQVKSSLHVY